MPKVLKMEVLLKEEEMKDIGPVDDEARKALAFQNLWHQTVPSPADAFLDAVEEAHPGEGLKEAILKEEEKLFGREGMLPFKKKAPSV